MLHLLLGTSGVGKTEYLYDKMCELAQGGNDKLMFIVPDQLSFETEKAFLNRLGPKECRNIKVFGFSRLCDYVFEQTGNRFMSFADEGIRNVVMSLAIEQVSDRLELFQKRASQTDLSQLMLNSIKEYKKCSITSEMLFETSKKVSDETLSKKLYETALLFDAYNAIIEKSYIDPLDSLTHITDVLSVNPIFEGYTIAVDSYYGFTSQEYDLLSLLMKQSKDIYFALCTDNLDGSNGDLFFVCDRTKKRLVNIARDNCVKIAPPITLTENKRFESVALSFVEQNVFRLQKELEDLTDSSVTLYEAKSVYDESQFVARNIKKLVVKEGYEYNDIAVITRQSDKYLGVIDTVFEKYGINYFMDKPQDIDTKSLIKFVMSCFDVITSGFDKEDVLALLKTGLTDIGTEDIADFENYLYIWDLSGKALFDEFKLNPRGFADEFKDSDIKLLSKLENTRKTIIDNLKDFYFSTKDTTALEISKALMKLIYKLHIKENLNLLCDKLEKNNEIALSEEQVRLYNIFVSVLDKMVSVIGDYNISAKRFSELLHISFVNTDISFIPHSLDEVAVACADRSLLSNKKAVFVIGAIDGEFPHTPVESGVYSDLERSVLLQHGIELSDSVEQLVPTEKYLAYKALTSASCNLFVSFYDFSLDGEKRTASVIVDELTQIFSNLFTSTSVDMTISDHLWSEKAAFEYLVSHFNDKTSQTKALYDYFSVKDEYKDIVNSIETALLREPKMIKDKELSKKLFGTDMKLSASQVDKFKLCKFEYFCTYGLRVRELRQAKIDSLEYGTMMHYFLEKFLKNHKDDDFSLITEHQVNSELEVLLDEYLELHLGGKESKSSRFMYLYKRMKRTAVSIVYRVVKEFSQSKFRPVDFELGIGEDIDYYTLKINDELTVKIRGSIDRVDIMDLNGIKYLRVVDYKTGKKQYRLSDVLYGINLQMLIYLAALNRNSSSYYGAQITPAGVLYMPSIAPVINVTESDKLSTATSKAKSKCKMQGIILEEMDVVKGMEEELTGEFLPVSLKGDILVGNLDSLATLEQFGALFSHVDSIVSEMALTLCDGDVSAVPAKGEYDPCKYCSYKSVCGYKDGDECNNIDKHDKDAVYRILLGEEGQNGEKLD